MSRRQRFPHRKLLARRGDLPLEENLFRRLAPGVEHTIPPAMQPAETYSRHDMIRLLAKDPNFGERPWALNKAKNVRYDHNIWGLEFTFKPVRIMQVDVPNGKGKFDRKNVWYLVYRVTNRSDQPVRFIPRFVLHSLDNNKYYTDRILPVAIDRIQHSEDPRRKLLNSAEITGQTIPPNRPGENKSVWGVATWEDIDPTTDEFAIYVRGLTNAYLMHQETGERKYTRKTLKINFWRPGDEFDESSEEIRYGVPDKVAYEWIYK